MLFALVLLLLLAAMVLCCIIICAMRSCDSLMASRISLLPSGEENEVSLPEPSDFTGMFFMAAAFSANACAIFSCVAIRADVSSLLLLFSAKILAIFSCEAITAAASCLFPVWLRSSLNFSA